MGHLRLIPGSLFPALTGLFLASIPAAHSTHPQDSREDRTPSAARPTALQAGDPRTVRMVYFRPNDRPFRAEVVDSTKAAILRIQAFFASEMQRHGHGNRTFRFETDDRGEPLVHRVDGKHADAHYLEQPEVGLEIWEALGESPIEVVVLDLSENTVPFFGGGAGGLTWRAGPGEPIDAEVLVPSTFSWMTLAHELGHTFDLDHDFRDDEYIMSYDDRGKRARLSACAAGYLAVHPYFNADIDAARRASSSIIDLVSPTGYPAGSRSTPVRLEVGNSPGLHQVFLIATTPLPHFAAGQSEVTVCRSYSGEGTATVEFDYDGFIPSTASSSLADPIVHRMRFRAVDTSGRTRHLDFSLYQLSERHVATLEEAGAVTSLAFSPDGSLASAGDSPVKLWNPGTRKVIESFGPASPARAVAISPDGAILASEHDGTVRLWEVAAGTNTATLEGRPGDHRFRSVAFSPDGKRLAVVSGDSTVKLWDPARTRHVDLDHGSWVTSLAFSPDGTRLATASGDGMVTLWDPAAGERTAVLEGHTDWVGAVAFSPDGATLASQSGWDGLVKLWDVKTQLTVATIENVRGGGSAVAFSPDGATLACASGQLVKLWDVGTRVRIDSLAHRGPVEALAFSPDGTTLASGAGNRGIELWDATEWLKPRPHGLVGISGDGQEGSPGAILDDPLVVEVRDQYGNGVAGAPVTFAVTEGDARLGGRFTVESTETGADGRAAVLLTLGTPGSTAVEARLLKADPVTFRAVTAEGPYPPVADGDPRKWSLPDRATVRLGKGRVEAWALDAPLAFSPDGRRLAVATSIGTWLYDPATSRELALLAGRWVTSLAFSPDGATLAAGSRRGTVGLWDVASGSEETTLYGHDAEVHSLAFSPDGAVLASNSRTRIKLWDVAGGGGLWDVATGEGTGPVALSPDGAVLTTVSGTRVRRWDAASAVMVATPDAATLDDEESTSLALSPDGATLATGSLSSPTVELWDVARGRVAATLRGHALGVLCAAFGSGGAILATGSFDGTARLWDAATESNVATFSHSTPVESVAFSPDGRTLASTSWGGEILLWDVPTERVAPIQGHLGSIRSLAFSPDGAALAIGSIYSAGLWDVRTGRRTATVDSSVRVNSVAFSPDGSMLAVGDAGITLWDVARSRGIATLEGNVPVQSLAFSPDGAILAAGYEGTIRLWDVDERREIATLEGHGHTWPVSSVAFSPDGAILASGSSDQTARLWEVETGQEIATFRKHWRTVSVAFSPGGATVATGFSNGNVRLFDVETRQETAALRGHPGGVHSVAFSPDGAALAAGSGEGPVVLWDPKARKGRTLEGHTGGIGSLAFSPDGAVLATGSRDGTVLLWDLAPRPDALRMVSGDGQQGLPGALLPGALVVEIRDESGHLLKEVPVTFTVTSGGGTLTAATAMTDSMGRAATALTLGSAPGPNTVEVAVEGLETMLFTANARATPDFDGDGEVGFADFFLFAGAFGGSDPRFDLDASGTVDFADFFLFAESFGPPQRARLLALARERIGLPDGPQLDQNWPNPFNSETVLSWFLLQPGPARLEVFALTGQRVAVLASGDHKAGLHRLHWDGRDGQGRPLASGPYLYRLVTAERVWARKLVLLR